MRTQEQVHVGDTLGRYELLACVGRGGMATVWAARHHGAHGFSRLVALKTMLPELSDDPDFQRMFLAEARVAARIRHPNVVETLDLGEDNGALYIVMEWIDGETLSAIMRTAFLHGGVPMPVALKLIVEACAGAHAAHELSDDENRPLGLVHRDVSPPNVLVSYDGAVKLADFGVAKTIEANSSVTLAGQIKGKMRYMAPEQLLGGPLNRRTDVFALGINLYQLTTGRHPWPGDTAAVTMRKILSELPTSPASFVDGYPAELERIVLKALSRNPEERFENAAEMALAVESFARSAGAVATTREIGAYVTELLGAHGAARRDALRAAVRDIDARTQQRNIDEAWDLESKATTSAAEPSHAGDSASIRPWGSHDSHPPPLTDASGVVAGFFARRFRRVAALSRAKVALGAGAALVLLTSVYALGGHRSSDGVASAATAMPSAAISPAESPRECSALSISTMPHATSEPTASATNVRRAPPVFGSRKAPIVARPAAKPTEESEPDVGF